MKVVRYKELQWIPASHEDPRRPGVVKKVMLQRADFSAGNVQMLNWARIESGQGFRAHYHEDMDEVFVVVSGTGEFRGQDQVVVLEAGDVVLTPMRMVHEMRNIGEDALNYLVFGMTLGSGGKTVVVG